MKSPISTIGFFAGLARFFVMAMAAGLVVVKSAGATIPIKQWKTDNGSTVLFVHSKAIPVVDVNIEFDAGSRHDPKGMEGLAAMTNDMLDKGMAGSDNMQANESGILDIFADAGVLHSSSSNMDRAGYTLRMLSEQALDGKAVGLMAGFLSSPLFPQDILEREKGQFIASIREDETRPEAIANRAFKRGIYQEHPYGRSATASSVKSITREDLIRFHAAYYVADRAVISIVGDVDESRARKMADKISSRLSRASSSPALLPDVPKTVGRAETIAHPASQAHVLIGMPALKRGDPDFFALAVGNYILGGGGFSSRLMNEVREKRGLSYSVYSQFQPKLQEGPFVIGLQTEKKQVNDALQVVKATLKDFLDKGPTEAELKSAKDHLVNSFAMQMDNNRKVLELITIIGYYHLPLDYLETWQANVRKVSVADVRKAMSEKLDADRMVTVVVGQ